MAAPEASVSLPAAEEAKTSLAVVLYPVFIPAFNPALIPPLTATLVAIPAAPILALPVF